MRRITLRLLAIALLMASAWFCWQQFYAIQQTAPAEQFTKFSKYDRIDLAMAQEVEMTKDPALGYVPRERMLAARRYAERIRQQPAETRGAIAGINWQERGPSNVSGRTRAILFDAADGTGNTVFAGSVAGGLWKTTNALAGTPTWNPINEFFENLAITTIAQDPGNSSVMYFGTGEGFYNADAVRGLGIWKSTNGGSSWTQLSSTDNSTFHYVQKIVIASNGDVYAATRNGGLQRSTDGGSSWSKVLGSGAGASSNRAADIEIASNGTFYAAMGLFQTDGIYTSSNGTSWSKLTSGLPSSGYQRIELACAPSNSSRVYAVFQGTNYDCSGIYRTDNAGASWTSLPVPGAYGMSNFCRGQAWYDLICAVDPNNSSRVFIGGIDILVSSNAGSNWTQLTQWYGGGGYQYAHADQHAMEFRPGSSSTILFGNDGGVFRSTNASGTSGTVSFISNGYNVTQFYSADLHPGSGVNVYLAGAQDNGTQRFNTSGIDATDEVTGGDGAFSHIDQDNGNIQISAYVYNQYRITSNSWGSYTTKNISSSAGRFINPTDYDDAANVLYCAYNGGQYALITGVGGSNTSGTRSISAFGGGKVSSVQVSKNVANRVYFGLDNGEVVRVDNASSTSPSATVVRNGSGYVSSVAIEDGNENHLLVTYSNYGVNSVYESTNGGSSWTSVEGNLPDMPVRWALFAPGNGDQALLATEVGVWTTDDLNGTSTNWGPTNGGLANVRTDQLQARSSDDQVIAATHGRGLYSSDDFGGGGTGGGCASTISSFPWNSGFESSFDSWTQSPSDDLDWARRTGGTPSSGTGPSGASAGSYYVYVEASSPNYPSKTTILNSPCLDLTSLTNPEIAFDYHMYGATMGTLYLEASTDGNSWSTVWSLSGDQGNSWNSETVSLAAYGGETELRLRWRGVTGSSYTGDISLDAISVRNASGGGGGCSGALALPYSESFESGLGNWSQVAGDDFDWTRRSGGTPSSNTGPSGAYDGTYYMYTEASSPNYSNKTAIFEGPCFDLSGVSAATFAFRYHMYGSTAMGSLQLQASTDGGSSWSSAIWSQSGNQGNSWELAQVDLSSYAGADVKLRFVGTTGTTWQGDMCVDDLSVTSGGGTGGCPAIDFAATTINSYGGTQDQGSHQVQDGGATLFIQNNAWKSISYPYTVTSNTVVEFEFRSTIEGEIHGVAFDNDNSISSNLTFKVHGTQNWGFTNYDNYSPTAWTTYVIPVGTFYTGTFDRLCFVSDHDGGARNGNSYFRNVKVYEGTCGTNVPMTAGAPQVGTQREGAFDFAIMPNPTRNNFHLQVPTEGFETFDATVFDASGRVVLRRTVNAGNRIEFGNELAAGIYMLRLSAEDWREDRKLIKIR